MSATVACPECGSKLRVPDDLSGQAVRCARCGTAFTAPAVAERVVSPPPDDTSPPPPAGGAFRPNLSPDDPAITAGRPDDPQGCPACGERIPRTSVRCPYCGDRVAGWPDAGRPTVMRHHGGFLLTLGFFSLVVLCACTPVGVMLGAMTWAFGQADLNKIQRGEMDPKGEDPTRRARDCGRIATVFGCLVIGFAVVMHYIETGGRPNWRW